MGIGKSADEKVSRRDRKAAEAYAESPLGLAVAARQRGDAFFQLEIENGQLGQHGWWTPLIGAPWTHTTNGGGRPDLLGQIEDVGWHLEHVGYVFAQTSAITKRRGSVTQGSIIGVYLFRAR